MFHSPMLYIEWDNVSQNSMRLRCSSEASRKMLESWDVLNHFRCKPQGVMPQIENQLVEPDIVPMLGHYKWSREVNLTGSREVRTSEFKLPGGFQVTTPTVATLAGLLGNIANGGGWSSFCIFSLGQTMCRKDPDYWAIGPYDCPLWAPMSPAPHPK